MGLIKFTPYTALESHQYLMHDYESHQTIHLSLMFSFKNRRNRGIKPFLTPMGFNTPLVQFPTNLLYPNEKEFNHWLEQWYLTYKSVLELSVKHEEFYLIGYESLCSNPKVWINVKDLLGINQEIKFLFKESKKVIGQTFDNNLSDKCYRLYESLVSKSFGT